MVARSRSDGIACIFAVLHRYCVVNALDLARQKGLLMPDKGTTRDHLDDVREELLRTRHVLQNMTDTAHRLHGELEDYKAANKELHLKLAIAQAEVDGYLKRHDRDRREIVALGERLGAMCAIQGDLMRQLEEARNE
jgi:chromosome segregation ATPase